MRNVNSLGILKSISVFIGHLHNLKNLYSIRFVISSRKRRPNARAVNGTITIGGNTEKPKTKLPSSKNSEIPGPRNVDSLNSITRLIFCTKIAVALKIDREIESCRLMIGSCL